MGLLNHLTALFVYRLATKRPFWCKPAASDSTLQQYNSLRAATCCTFPHPPPTATPHMHATNTQHSLAARMMGRGVGIKSQLRHGSTLSLLLGAGPPPLPGARRSADASLESSTGYEN